MSNIPIRFGRGQGLEAAANAQTQQGLLELSNVRLGLRETIEKRPGSEQLALTTGVDPEDVLDTEGLQAMAYRKNELCIFSDRSLYSRNRAQAATEVSSPVGTATDEQIDAAKVRAAAELGDPTISFELPGHPDAGSFSFGAAVPVRLTTQSSGSPSGNTAVIAVVGGRVLISAQTSEGVGFSETVAASGGSDVRLVFGRQDSIAGGVSVRWLAAWRVGNNLVWARVTVNDITEGVLPSSFDVTVLETIAVANRPYDLAVVNTNPSAVGTTPTLYFAPTSTSITARSISLATMVPALDRTITTSFTITSSDCIIPVADTLAVNAQTAAFFRRPTGGRHEYFPLRFDTVVSQDGIAVPTIPDTRRPTVIRSSDFLVQLVGLLEGNTVVNFFVGAPGSAPQWVATGQAGSDVSGLHTVTAVESATTWQIRRNGVTTFTETFSNVSTRRFVEPFAALFVGVRTAAGSIQRQAYTPLTDGPYSDYATIGAATGHVSLTVSASRVAYVYKPSSTTLRVASSADGVAWNDGPAETFTEAPIDESNGALIITAAVGANEIAGTWFYRIGNTLSRRAVTTADPVQGAVLSISAASGPIYAEDIGAIELVVVGSNPFFVYEFGGKYAVQVDPRLVTLSAGNFGIRGPWTPARMVQEVPLGAVGGGTIVACDVAQVQDARIALWQVSGGTVPGIYVSVVTDHLEIVGGVQRIDATGTRPRVVVNHGDGSALLTYLSGAGSVQILRWTPSTSAISFTGTGIVPINSIYETLAVSQPDRVLERDKYVLIVRASGTEYRVIRYNAATLAILFNELYNISAISANVLAATVEYQDIDNFIVRGCHPGPAGISTWRLNLPDAAGGSLITNNANSFAILPADVRRLAITTVDQTPLYNLLIQTLAAATTIPIVQLVRNAAGVEAAALVRSYFRAAVWSSAIRHSDGRTYGVLAGISDGNAACSGYFLVDLDTQEIVGRSFVAEGENFTTQPSRLTTCHLDFASIDQVRDADRLLFMAAVQSRGGDADDVNVVVPNSDLATIGFATTVFDSEGVFVPAELDGVLLHPAAGYPRAYTGDNTHEHDWHCIPEIVGNPTTPVGGSLSAGTYGCAVTYQASDFEGNIYRSRPSFANPVVAAAADQIVALVTPLALTERRDVKIVLWRTTANGTVYYRDVSVSNNPTATATLTLSGTRSDTTLRLREILDVGRVIRDPCPATDFCAVAGGRFWTRDPERGSLVRFSTPRVEGFAPSWNFPQGLEMPSQRDVTALGDLDGRIVLFTEFDLAVAQGSGPDATGANGTFSGPDRIPSETGATGQTTLAEMPQGLVFGSSSGPRVLSRSLDTQDLGEQVYRYFEFDGFSLRRSLYLPNQATLLLASTDGTDNLDLRLHVDNGRWAQDTGRPILSMAISRNGEVAYLTADGRLLIEGDTLTPRYQNLLAVRTLLGAYPAHLFNGTLEDQVTGATLVAENGAFVSNDPAGTLGVFNRSSYEFTGLDTQDFVTSDAAIADIGAQQSLTIVWAQTLDVAPVSQRAVMGKQTNDALDPDLVAGWLVVNQLGGPRLSVDQAGGGAFVQALLDPVLNYTVGERRYFVAVIDFAAGELRFGSDVEATVVVPFDPSLDYATTAFFRIGDARFASATPPIDGKVHWVTMLRGAAATSVTDCRAAAVQFKAADETAAGVGALAVLPDRTDGDFGYVTSVSTPWIREPSPDQLVHPGFVFEGFRVFGKYLGSHAMTAEVYFDFESVPRIVAAVPRAQMDDNAATVGDDIVYCLDKANIHCFAVRVRILDGGEPNPTYRLEGIDVYYHGDKSQKPFEMKAQFLFQRPAA